MEAIPQEAVGQEVRLMTTMMMGMRRGRHRRRHRKCNYGSQATGMGAFCEFSHFLLVVD